MGEMLLHKRAVLGIMFTLLLLTSVLTLQSNIQPVKAQPQTWTVDDDDGTADFSSIQEAINDPQVMDGDTIYVHNGTYYEHINAYKSLTLNGEDKRATIIDGSLNDTVIKIVADRVRISEFTIRNGYEGIIIRSDGNTVSNNNITMSEYEGLSIESSTDSVITDNLISFNGWDGVYMLNTNNTVLRGNTITSNNVSGVHIDVSYNNTISGNTLSNNTIYGLRLDDSNKISVVENTLSWNELAGIGIFMVADSFFCHNNFLNHTEQIRSDDSLNTWDDGYPSGGNYWSDYNGTDFYSGSSQNETGTDGIGDASYLVDKNNQDRYPLMGPIRFFDAGTWNGASYSVTVVSNSTVSKFRLNKAEKVISFNVSGETGLGFCRVTIPNVIIQDLLQGGYTVFVDGEEPLTLSNWIDETRTYTYFTYLHSEHEVVFQALDTTPPAISILSPENKMYAGKDVFLSFTVNETASWIGYSLDGQMNETISGNTMLSGLPDGIHTITVYANDTAGNMGSSGIVYFTIDTVSPNIEILSPENKTYTTSSVPLSLAFNEAISWIGYSLDGQVNVTITGNTTVSGLSNGLHGLIVYANDTAGNTGGSEMIFFTIETRREETFPTWVLAVVLAIVVVVAVLLVYFTKIKKTKEKAE
jgi:parallel beta-helix repeat protein